MCFLRISLPQRTLAAQPRFWIRTRFLSGKSSLVPFIWYFGAMRSQRGQSGRGWEWASANTYLLVTNRLLDVVRAVGKKTNFMWHIPSSIHQELWWVMNADVFSSQTKVIYICLLPVTQIQTELPNTPMRTGHLWRQTRQTLNFWTPNNYNQSLPNLCCRIASIEKYLRLGLHKTHQCSGEEECKQFLIVCSFILWFIDSFIHPSFHNNRASWDGKKWALAELLGSTSTRPGQPRFCWDTLEQMP